MMPVKGAFALCLIIMSIMLVARADQRYEFFGLPAAFWAKAIVGSIIAAVAVGLIYLVNRWRQRNS